MQLYAVCSLVREFLRKHQFAFLNLNLIISSDFYTKWLIVDFKHESFTPAAYRGQPNVFFC